MTTILDSPALDAVTLSTMLREGTRPQHETAENQSFVTRLMKGELDREAYADYLAQHYPVYVALEAAGEELRAAGLDHGVVLDELLRVPSLEADLEFLFGPRWRETIDILPATEAYAARLRETSTWFGGWVAHAYTRYLGDLSGGQAIGQLVQRHYGLGAEGTSFYRFAAIPKPKVFKDEYRARLDALPFDAAERERVVAEAQRAFDLNAAVFQELGARHG